MTLLWCPVCQVSRCNERGTERSRRGPRPYPGRMTDRPAAHQPDWPDRSVLDDVTAQLRVLPPLVFAGECDALKERLGAVARGEAFLLQGGDCAETVGDSTAHPIRKQNQTLA